MRTLIIVSFLALLVIATGCDVNPSKITPEYAEEMADKMTFAKDEKSGLCFGFIASRKTGVVSQTGLGATEVPCDKVKHLIGR